MFADLKLEREACKAVRTALAYLESLPEQPPLTDAELAELLSPNEIAPRERHRAEALEAPAIGALPTFKLPAERWPVSIPRLVHEIVRALSNSRTTPRVPHAPPACSTSTSLFMGHGRGRVHGPP